MVGNATQVISVVGSGGSNAKMDIYQRSNTGWEPVEAGIPTHIGSAGLAAQAKSGYPATPMGVFTLPFAFGTAPNPGGGLKYVQVDSNHWWNGDDGSATFNTMQVCHRAQCPFDTGASENLQIPQYKHAVVMGVNPNRQPGKGAAFFFHHRRRSDRRLCRDRRCQAGAGHSVAAAGRGHGDHSVSCCTTTVLIVRR